MPPSLSDALRRMSHRVTAALDSQHFLDDSLYKTTLNRVAESIQGPVTMEAADVYLEVAHGALLRPWKDALGDILWKAIVADLAEPLHVLARAFDAANTVQRDTRLPPTLVLIVGQSILTACRMNSPDVTDAVHEAYHELLDPDEVTDELEAILPLLIELHRPLEELGTEEPDAEGIAKRTFALMAGFAVPVTEVIALRAPRPATDGSAPIMLPQAPASQVKQLDDSYAPSAATELAALFKPERPQYPDGKAQWADTLSQFDSPYKDALQLWRKAKEAPLDSINAMEAWAMDSVGRILCRLYTPDQVTLLLTRIPIEEVIGPILRFVVEYQNRPPAMSWPQLRVSFTSSAIAMVTSPDDLIPTATALYEALGLQDEVGLLTATLTLHRSALTEAVLPFKALGPVH